jgi:hypothetical protein
MDGKASLFYALLRSAQPRKVVTRPFTIGLTAAGLDLNQVRACRTVQLPGMDRLDCESGSGTDLRGVRNTRLLIWWLRACFGGERSRPLDATSVSWRY